MHCFQDNMDDYPNETYDQTKSVRWTHLVSIHKDSQQHHAQLLHIEDNSHAAWQVLIICIQYNPSSYHMNRAKEPADFGILPV